MLNKDKSKFFNKGFLEYKNLLDKKKCKSLNDRIFNLRKIDQNIFLSKSEYLLRKKKGYKYVSKNILDKVNKNFIYENKRFNKKIENILGKDYFLYASRIICALPHELMPKWISEKMDLESPNIGEFIKDEFRDIRFFHGIDYHMDLIDFSKENSDFITVYIYLDKVTKKMSPLNILPKTHLGGAASYPHDLIKKKDYVIYKPTNQKKIVSKNKVLIGTSGDVWLWHGCLLHGTNFNVQGNRPRLSLRLIFRQKKKSKETLMNKLNAKIINTVALEKMRQNHKYKNLNKNKNISKYFKN